MTEVRACCEETSHSPASRQLGVGDYVGRVGWSAAPRNCHLSTIVHATARKVPRHAHDWPFLSMLLRGSYISRTRTREMEFKHGAAVYHPRAFQHRDEIGRHGGVFFAVQLSPDLLGSAASVRDVALVTDEEAYAVLALLYGALCARPEPLEFESLAADLAGCLTTPKPPARDGAPAWLSRTAERLREDTSVSLHELARDAGVHATTLTRAFRRHHRCSVGAFHARARARRAFTAVVGSAEPLSEICHGAGYADQSHMTRDFKRAFAATPGQLRRATLDA